MIDKKRRLLVVALVALSAACHPTSLDTGDVLDSGAALSAQPPNATVVLVHGMGGFRNIGPLDYWFHVPKLWERLGTKLYVAQDTSVASIEQRAGELKKQLDAIEGPLVLVGHSQGGLDARYLISRLGYGDRVKALITIATPHHGSPVADVLLGLAPGPVQDAADALIGLLGWSLDGAREMTTSYMADTFNPTVPDVAGVTYWSFSGYASPLGVQPGSGWLHAPLLPTWTLLTSMHIDSDGIVPVASQRWGYYVGGIPADHIGEANQPLGETPGFHALAFYAQLLQKMHDAGW
jgi:triacylglycerol lipase